MKDAKEILLMAKIEAISSLILCIYSFLMSLIGQSNSLARGVSKEIIAASVDQMATLI